MYVCLKDAAHTVSPSPLPPITRTSGSATGCAGYEWKHPPRIMHGQYGSSRDVVACSGAGRRKSWGASIIQREERERENKK